MSGSRESMIERVARAIYNVGRSGDELWTDHSTPDDPIAAIGLAEARAAIEAMREPPNMHEGWGDGLNADYRLIWEVMINAALGDHP